MSGDQDLIKLYSTRILALAADIPRLGHLPDPTGRAERRSPLCGSTISVEVTLEDGRVSGFAQTVRACALGQASAAILGTAVIGCTGIQLRQARDELLAMLSENAPAPAAPFGEYAVLAAARDYRNRHPSILLAIEATLAAVENAEADS